MLRSEAIRILLIVSPNQSKYVYVAKGALNNYRVKVEASYTKVIHQYVPLMKHHRITHVVCSDLQLLKLLVKKERGIIESKQATLEKYKGSVFHINNIPCVIWPELKHFYTIPSTEFFCRTVLQKITHTKFKEPDLVWDIVTSSNFQELLDKFSKAYLIAVDIETTKIEINYRYCRNPQYDGLWANMKPKKSSKKIVPMIPSIAMVGYCGLFKNANGGYYSYSIVLPIDDFESILRMRLFNNLQPSKVMQNGGYDSTYFIRFGAPLRNWFHDTFHLMHCWLAEMKRDLNTIGALFMTKHMYYKDENDEYKNQEYCAKDVHTTLWSYVAMLKRIPEWTKTNYTIEFKKVFPAITCGLEGFRVDIAEKERLEELLQHRVDTAQTKLDAIIYEGFNANSPKQVLAVMQALSYVKIENTDDIAISKWAEKHPINELIAACIKDVREARKALSTYVNAKLFNGRLLFEINHGGTDTGRASSKASNLWVGTQIQNIDTKLRSMYIADEGWILGNRDGSQAESRCTAYMSQDKNLINTVETAPDFHTRNASLFFGMPEDKITRDIRTTGKRVNHGSNYNMGPAVLIDTMGVKNVYKASKLLKLPSGWNAKRIAQHLLRSFEKTYPDIKSRWYDEIIEEIGRTKKLVGPTGWTRYCFGKPTKKQQDKLSLNSYVAHGPQSLNVMILDEAYFDIWYEMQIKRNIMRLKAQVHDEIIFQVREDNDFDFDIVANKLKELMERPIKIHGRTMVIPTPSAGKAKVWSKLK